MSSTAASVDPWCWCDARGCCVHVDVAGIIIVRCVCVGGGGGGVEVRCVRGERNVWGWGV